MIVAVTGTTGALGVPTVRLLEERGHRVRPVRLGDGPPDICGADAVLHLATRIPGLSEARGPDAWQRNDWLRRDATHALVDVALECGVGTIVYPSVTSVYADGGDRLLEFGDAVEPTDILVSTLDAEAEMDRFTTAGGRGVTLRLATLYGPHARSTRDVLAQAAAGVSGFPGPADAYQPLLWDEDAAAALVAAVESTHLTGGYDVVDDEPLTRADLAVALAAAVGLPRVDRPPTEQVRADLGERASFLLRSQRVSNRRFRAATGWQPRVPDATVGFGRLRHLTAN